MIDDGPSARQVANELISTLLAPVGGRQVAEHRDRRYYGLRAVAGYFKVLAWLSAAPWMVLVAISLFGGLMALQDSVLGGLAALVLGPLLCAVIGAAFYLSFMAAAESILVILDIESNTRRAAEHLDGRA